MDMTFDRLMHLAPDELVEANRHRDRYFPVRAIRRSGPIRMLPRGMDIGPRLMADGVDPTAFMQANRVAGLLVLKEGSIRLERYGLGNDEESRWSSFSLGKSVTGILVGAALQDGHIASLGDPVTRYLPDLDGSAYGACNVGSLLNMSSGIAWREGYRDGQSDLARMYQAVFARRQGGVVDFMRSLPRVAAPDTRFLYSTGETHLLGAIAAAAAGKPLAEYLSERIWARFGMEADGYWTLDSEGGQELAGGGLNFVLRDYGRIGQFMLEEGAIDGEAIVPKGWIEQTTNIAGAPNHLRSGRLYDGYPFGYGGQWWLYPEDGGPWPEHVRAITGMGIFGQFLYLNPKVRVVVAIHSAWPDPWVAENERRVHQFIATVVRATAECSDAGRADQPSAAKAGA